MNLSKSYLNFCKKNNFELNADQLDLIKEISNFYNINFNKSFLKKIFNQKKTEIRILFARRCRSRKDYDFKFFFWPTK